MLQLNKSDEALENEAESGIKLKIDGELDESENESEIDKKHKAIGSEDIGQSICVKKLVTDDIKDEDIVKEESNEGINLPQITTSPTSLSTNTAAHHFWSAS